MHRARTLGERFRWKRLLQKCQASSQEAVADNCVVRITKYVKHLHFAVAWRRVVPPACLHPSGHNDVCHHQMNWVKMDLEVRHDLTELSESANVHRYADYERASRLTFPQVFQSTPCGGIRKEFPSGN